jgi:nitrogen fixation/metabolism regulation signal transduction histidine kinase
MDMASHSFEQEEVVTSDWVVPLGIITLVSLLLLVLFNLARAFALLKEKRTGSRFTLRLMSAFSILTIIPVLVVSYFSMDFIGKRIDSWYNVPIKEALGDSLELSRKSLEKGSEVNLRDIEDVARQLFRVDPSNYPFVLAKSQRRLNAREIMLLDPQNRTIAYSSEDMGDLFGDFPKRNVFVQLALNGSHYGLEPGAKEGEQYSRVAVRLQVDATSAPYVLTALFPIPYSFSMLGESVERTRYKYLRLEDNKENIKNGFRFALLVISVLLVLFSLWAAFIYSTRLTRPVRTLLEGTRSVASGDLQTKLPVSDKDDFSLLARSFNTMTSRLLSARQESERSRLALQRQRDYLDVVLNHLTSGVLTIDQHYSIKRINEAGAQLLALDVVAVKGESLQTLAANNQMMADFVEATLPHIRKDKTEWKVEFNTLCKNTRQVFVCQGANLPELLDGTQGTVLVFDDITDLIQAEHDAAWSEVAKRLAHEIKNPLTPIQLSAERLRYKLLPELNEKSADLLIRMSETITQQVESMKTMVNAFSDYARTPALQYQRINVKKFITDTVILYQSNEQKVTIALDLATLPKISLDIHRMRQVLVNLIKNALEALEEKKEDGLIKISAYVSEANEVVIQIADNGPGIDEKLLPTLYDPYISSKVKGSGLGLAIVKKIIEEHAGSISARNSESDGCGAVFTIILPIR